MTSARNSEGKRREWGVKERGRQEMKRVIWKGMGGDDKERKMEGKGMGGYDRGD